MSALFTALICVFAYADDGVNTGYGPYSMYGIGRLARKGTAYSNAMGGVGVANRNTRYINTLNPAAVTARDSLAFMADFSLMNENAYYAQGNKTSVDNTFNFQSITMSFPIWKSSAFMIGVNPFSGLGYRFTNTLTDKEVIGQVGNVVDIYYGDGTLYEVYLAAGATFWRRLSIGAQMNYYFGSMQKNNSREFTSSNYASIYTLSDLPMWGISGKFGLQYEQPIGKDKLIFGATYRLATRLKGNEATSLIMTKQSSVVDTLAGVQKVNLENIHIPGEVSVGLSYKHSDKLHAEFNYTMSDWRKSGMDSEVGFKAQGFTSSLAQSFNVGFEFTPNRNDIRYYMRRVTYRVGAYYSEDYYRYTDRKVSAAALTLGMTFPVFRWSNGITVGMELGQRGSVKNNMIRERFISFSVGLNIYDIWFVKPKYE